MSRVAVLDLAAAAAVGGLVFLVVTKLQKQVGGKKKA